MATVPLNVVLDDELESVTRAQSSLEVGHFRLVADVSLVGVRPVDVDALEGDGGRRGSGDLVSAELGHVEVAEVLVLHDLHLKFRTRSLTFHIPDLRWSIISKNLTLG